RSMRCRTPIAVAALLAAGLGAARGEPLTLQRIFSAPDLSGPTLRAMQLSPDGRFLAYLRGATDDKDRLDLWAYEFATGRHRLLVDARALAPQTALSAAEAARRERQRTASLSGIVEYQFAPDSRRLLIPSGGELYLYDLGARAAGAVRRLTTTAADEIDARFSPRGRYVSYVRDQNLYALELASGRELAVTQDCAGAVSCGVAEFIAQEEMDRHTGYWWSPDETRIVYARVDESMVDEVERFEIDAERIRVVRQRYPAAGRPNARVTLWVATLANPSAALRVDLGDDDHYLARVEWLPDGRAFAVQRQSRDQRRLDLLRVEAGGAAATLLLRETSDTWIELHDELTFLPDGRFIWASDRDGFRHLYLHDAHGELLHRITAGAWSVAGDGSERAIRGVDLRRGWVYFMGNRDSPLERHLYRAPLAGGATVRLTAASGWHAVRMSRDASVFVDQFSDRDTPPRVTAHDRHGRLIATIVANKLDRTHPYAPYADAHVPVRTGTLTASDGQTLYWQMLLPADFAAGRRYPVVVDLYGGPGSQRVRDAWMGGARPTEGLFRQLLAQRGYVVFTLDNRGTGFRGVRFATALHRRLGSVEVEDQVVGVDYLRRLPFVDPERIAVMGWSYGGYLAARCVLLAPEYFRAAIVGAPVTDWALYDTHYTERYLGTPQDNRADYRAASVLTAAG
ncbi:MAG: DPP IV N-terminal domain-containing protein, partial [Steroidobacteraceae bacterium]|nr:DPP IV N-terminal domain-containing protein [Steroidobacteraceae bacterium]